MTRINTVPVECLSDKHLLAEYRELPRIFTAVAKIYDSGNQLPTDIPPNYKLGAGHVKFFYDKLLWLIDHGASFYFHHNWATWKDHLNRTFPFVKNHVLLKEASKLGEAVDEIKLYLTEDKVNEIVTRVPDDWLLHHSDPLSPQEMKEAYLEFISNRIDKIELLAEEAENAR